MFDYSIKNPQNDLIFGNVMYIKEQIISKYLYKNSMYLSILTLCYSHSFKHFSKLFLHQLANMIEKSRMFVSVRCKLCFYFQCKQLCSPRSELTLSYFFFGSTLNSPTPNFSFPSLRNDTKLHSLQCLIWVYTCDRIFEC